MFVTALVEGSNVDSGFEVALNFVVLGLFWLFAAAFLIGIVQAVRTLLG